MTGADRIRGLEQTDLEELVALCAEHAEYERAPFQDDGLAQRLRDSLLVPEARALCLVVEAGDGLAGFAVAAPEFSTWDGRCHYHLDCLYLRPPHRGRGLGEELMRRVATAALQAGAVELQWQTPDWNHAAARFYERLGAVARTKRRFTLPLEACRQLAGQDSVPSVGRHRERRTRLAALDRCGAWLVKRYEITLDDEPLAAEVLRAAREVISGVLPPAPATPALAFAVLHLGEDACWLVVCRWEAELLHQQMFAAPLHAPECFERLAEGELVGCVWELRVHAHERDALVRNVLDPAAGPELEAWSRDRLDVPAARQDRAELRADLRRRVHPG